jgi:hypothetical protein
MGLMALGSAPSFALGGLITSYTNSQLTVFYVEAAILACTTFIFGLTVEETFGREKRAERRKEQQEREYTQAQEANEGTKGQSLFEMTFAKVLVWITAPLHLFARLLPAHDPLTGRRNYRLFVLGISFFCSSFVNMYSQGIVVYSTTKFHFGAKEVS